MSHLGCVTHSQQRSSRGIMQICCEARAMQRVWLLGCAAWWCDGEGMRSGPSSCSRRGGLLLYKCAYLRDQHEKPGYGLVFFSCNRKKLFIYWLCLQNLTFFTRMLQPYLHIKHASDCFLIFENVSVEDRFTHKRKWIVYRNRMILNTIL